MADWIAQAAGKAHLTECCICGRLVDTRRDEFGAAKRDGAKAVWWHDRCYRERFGKTAEQYEEMKRTELQTELTPDEYRQLDELRKGNGMAKTESVWALVFENGKVWRERRDGYPTKVEGLFVCKTKHLKVKGKSAAWEAIDEGSGLRLVGPFGTKKECEAALTDATVEKLRKHRENSAWRAAVRLNELVYARGSMPTAEYNQLKERYKAEELDKFKQRMEKEEAVKKESGWKEAPRSEEPVMDGRIETLKGERVCITGSLATMTRSEAFIRLKAVGGIPCERFNGKVTLFVIAANAGRDKRKKADAAIAKGQAVKVVDGTEFLEALAKAEEGLKAKAGKQMAAKAKSKAKSKAEAEVDVKVHPEKGGVQAIEMAPKKEERMKELENELKELRAELKATRKELDDVWKENASLKARKPERKEVPPAPKAPKGKVKDAAAVVSLKAMQEWCEGKGLVATQKAEGCCIWVEGDSKPYADELKERGFRFAKKRKSWYFDPKRAA